MHVERRNDREEGSAFVEALAVMMFFTVALACAVTIGRSYLARVISGQAARTASWAGASEACDVQKNGLWELTQGVEKTTSRRDVVDFVHSVMSLPRAYSAAIEGKRALCGERQDNSASNLRGNRDELMDDILQKVTR